MARVRVVLAGAGASSSAPDAELPALARKVLDEKMNDRKAIKQLIKNWQADHLRA